MGSCTKFSSRKTPAKRRCRRFFITSTTLSSDMGLFRQPQTGYSRFMLESACFEGTSSGQPNFNCFQSTNLFFVAPFRVSPQSGQMPQRNCICSKRIPLSGRVPAIGPAARRCWRAHPLRGRAARLQGQRKSKSETVSSREKSELTLFSSGNII